MSFTVNTQFFHVRLYIQTCSCNKTSVMLLFKLHGKWVSLYTLWNKCIKCSQHPQQLCLRCQALVADSSVPVEYLWWRIKLFKHSEILLLSYAYGNWRWSCLLRVYPYLPAHIFVCLFAAWGHKFLTRCSCGDRRCHRITGTCLCFAFFFFFF